MDSTFTLDEKYMMVRCLIAMAHADGVVAPEEVAYLQKLIAHIPFSPVQKAQFTADFEAKQDIMVLYSIIENPAARAQVLYFARVLAYADGVLDATEQVILDRMHASIAVGDGAGVGALQEMAQKVAGEALPIEYVSQVEREKALRPDAAYFAAFNEIMSKLR